MSTLNLKLEKRSDVTNGTVVTRELKSTTLVSHLKAYLDRVYKIPPERITVLIGFPPRPLDLNDETVTLDDLGIKTGETLFVEERAAPAVVPAPPARTAEPPPRPSDCRLGVLMKMVVPSDNSCLFTSIGFVLNGKIDTTVGSLMRQIIATEVSSDKETYNEAMLGKTNEEYCEWILQASSWGGAIEVAILSRFYGVEMAVVDTLNAIINRFGEDRDYGQRVFLLFDGVHYDPLYLEQSEGGMQTIFPSENMEIFEEAEQLAREAKSSRQFTDLDKFTLRCLDCGVRLTGQAGAQQHAKETQHTNFGEI